MDKLNKIVEESYKVFSGNKPSEYIDACTYCCMTEKDAQKLKSLPLREIPLELLKEYQDAAKPSSLNVSELKYFVPRYLELVKDFQFPTYEPLLSFDRFGRIDILDWTKDERSLLEEYALEFLDVYINTINQKYIISPIEVLLMFYKGNFKIDSFLDRWEKANSKESLMNFQKLLQEMTWSKRGVLRITDPFADNKFSKQVLDWLESDRVKRNFKSKIEKAIIDSSEIYNQKELQGLSNVYDIIR